jgi:hypothetical protein
MYLIRSEPSSAVGIVTGRKRDWRSSRGRIRNFLHSVQTGSGAHPASYPMGTGGGKEAGA